jgi:hypothetical protein
LGGAQVNVLMKRISKSRITTLTEKLNLEKARLGDYGLDIHSINKGLAECDSLDARVIEAVHVIPDWSSISHTSLEAQYQLLTVDLLRFIILVFNARDVDTRLVGEEETVGLEILVTS